MWLHYSNDTRHSGFLEVLELKKNKNVKGVGGVGGGEERDIRINHLFVSLCGKASLACKYPHACG